ncbi:2-dehydro-3-deoxyphosphogluconate aldolase/(4S)-4-hydroxy-2-oxoglutarate aldolase [Enterococcus sp. PF1-24]|uniref:bifunctional 4-hydroxy-2-oxoglutarate aldolase/2-dehydro-3-deoxy-phosphogluconate aldolase n=1 Tax=unclassified Enterococcus TaxID=2608891 RepID=UPI002475C5D0|nr:MULTISPECIES: bifunctional 4-hydroxy-2-oxoglutarate aldolase/2-dehydro-3-deoxy-phosphogluconate aldolase [unclassified Enterococcus]MDH6363504.1 2-dehydro-3-deoxyphosphogluconate aldolase/(4S)-4-hydroxy-2-oxoglutarate aldolase [Enterococcus sp. PFB1-1]MDH6400598.1 2-dehydro-3-deoxyphosphogluconate aldolase/(4S)-4-hydroxy-2-oxoglutarate aldolase [Enterococcus sp. PF1-24]
MKRADYPRFTIIMRGYTFQQADAILTAMKGFEKEFAVELTLNTPDALQQIQQLTEKYGDSIYIGAGTVRSIKDVKDSIQAGAQFLLGPHAFTQEMLDYAKQHQVLSVPAAMTPSEINEMFDRGADMVKVFPASVVTPRFFKDVQAPLGKLPLMGVGGISIENAQSFLSNGASYLGLGSGMFNKRDLAHLDSAGLAESMQKLLSSVEGVGV